MYSYMFMLSSFCLATEYHGASKDQVLVVSLAANIMSRYTSFVAVNRRQDKVKGQAEHVDIPVAERRATSAKVSQYM